MNHLDLNDDRHLVCFTDLDGTLLDHQTYAVGEAGEAVRRLSDHGVPLIFCSSKTFAEQIHLQRLLGLNQPFIFENGSAVAIPNGYFEEDADLNKLDRPEAGKGQEAYLFYVLSNTDPEVIGGLLAHFNDVKSFSDVPDTELSRVTGLKDEALGRARARWFTETLLSPLDPEKAGSLASHLAPAGLELSKGGRFFTVQSSAAGKGKAVKWLSGIFRKKWKKALKFAAIGDSPNDVPMLNNVDLPFLVQTISGDWTKVEIPGLIRVKGIGPAGFAAAVDILLNPCMPESK
ncbi:MAG: HAD-IIB family hydrolase [Lewinellaceae bacterium]|nr:HAD-IIB family hydrolase [Lewinellaceae bacterium]